MAVARLSFLAHLKCLSVKPRSLCLSRAPPCSISVRFLSYATAEEAAAERRRRKRRQRIEPPLNSLRHSTPQRPPQQRQPPSPSSNPNAPKLPEPVSALSGNRLNLHNRILRLIRENDLDEAALLTRHSVYSNCRPTIFTVNAVLTAQLRQSRYSDLLSLHRFINQAGIAANVITHNLLLNAYCDCRKTATALEYYKQLINDAPVDPSPTTFRILTKGLVDDNKLDRAMELKGEMLSQGFSADPIVYNHLMSGHVKNSNPDGVFALYEDLKERLGVVSDGIVYGNLMKGHFLRGMEKEAMECYEEAVGEDSKVKMSAMAFNYVLDGLSKNGKFDEALLLFDRLKAEHDPPRRLMVNLGTFNVITDGYCSHGRFGEAIKVFRSMGEKGCSADTLSYNNLIDRLCSGGLLAEAEELFGEMGDPRASPDEYTHVLLMDACFQAGRAGDAAGFFTKMIESGLRPNLAVYNKLVDGLVAAGEIGEAKSFYDLMVKKLKMDDASHQFIMGELFKVGRSDEVLQLVSNLLDEEGDEFTTELQEFVKGELAKEGREEDVVRLMEAKQREKEEARAREIAEAEAAKASAKAAVASLIPSKLFRNKDADKESPNKEADTEPSIGSANNEESDASPSGVAAGNAGEASVGENAGKAEEVTA